MMKDYKNFLKNVGSLLKDDGFTKFGDTFYFNSEGNIALIDFQKSKDNFGNGIKFTINLGIQSTVIAKTLELHNGDIDRPIIDDCHWRKRIGFLLPEKQDRWWVIENNVSGEKLAIEISDLLKKIAIPILKNHIKDQDLKQEWLSGISEGITELQSFIYLTTLLKLSGDNRLASVVEKYSSTLKGKSFEYAAREHIKQLQSL